MVEFVSVRRRRWFRAPGRRIGPVVLALVVGVGGVVAAATIGDRAGEPVAVPERPVAVAAPPVAAEQPVPTPAPTPVPTPEPPVPASRPALVQRLEGLLAAPGVAGRFGVVVVDEHGRTLVDHDGDVPLLPASTQKLVTAAAALESLGPDFRFRTTVAATAPVQAGTVAGDLVLVGSGDPVLATPLYGEQVYPARPRTRLEDLADAVVAAGVRRVTGAVIGDPTAFGAPRDAEGWQPRYFWDFDARHVTGLTVDAGLVARVDPVDDELVIELAPDPSLQAAVALRELLVERGVEVVGGAGSGRDLAPAPVELAAVDSPTLLELLEHTVKRSDNHLADHLLHRVGLEQVGEATWRGGDRGVRAALAPLGLDWSGVHLADGSGLSRADRVPTRFLVELEAAMDAGPFADAWRSLLAVAGTEGTLRHRLVDTPAQGRFLGKTGTLDDVRAVAGTVVGPDDQRYHLAVVANDLTGDSIANARALMDNIALALADDLYGCAPTALPTDPPGQPSGPVACAIA